MSAVSASSSPDSAPPFLAALSTAAPASAPLGPDWLADLRRSGADLYRRAGLPGPRVETWKYTSLGDVSQTAFAPAPAEPAAPSPAVKAALARALDLAGPRVVVVNGRVVPELSSLSDLPEGVRLGSLRQALDTAPDRLASVLGALADLDALPLAALNTHAFTDGLLLEVPAGVRLSAPVHLVCLADGAAGPVQVHPRHLVILGKGARATLAESHLGSLGGAGDAGDAATFTNGVMEISLAEGASLTHGRVLDGGSQDTHVFGTAVRLAAGAHLESLGLSLGGGITRNELHVALSGAGARADLSVAYGLADSQHLDTTFFVDHQAPEATSRQTLKGVLDNTARAVFQGKVHVARGAQKTDGEQLHRALMLSRGAEVDTKPELEIYADDVVCGHGATVGEIDAEQVFYLQSRGIDADTARALLVEAFLDEVIAAFPAAPLREAFAGRVRTWQASRHQATWAA